MLIIEECILMKHFTQQFNSVFTSKMSFVLWTLNSRLQKTSKTKLLQSFPIVSDTGSHCLANQIDLVSLFSSWILLSVSLGMQFIPLFKCFQTEMCVHERYSVDLTNRYLDITLLQINFQISTTEKDIALIFLIASFWFI